MTLRMHVCLHSVVFSGCVQTKNIQISQKNYWHLSRQVEKWFKATTVVQKDFEIILLIYFYFYSF